MSIKRVERDGLEKFKPGWKRDRRTGAWYTYQVDYYEKGVRKRKRGFHSEQEAKEWLYEKATSERLEAIGLSPVTGGLMPTVRELFERKMSEEMTVRDRTFARRVLGTFVEMLPQDFPLGALRRKHFKDYIDLRVSQGVKPETANREMTVIAGTVNRAADWFAELEDWTPPKKYWAPDTSKKGRERVISPEEERKLIEWLTREKLIGEDRIHFRARMRTGLTIRFGLLTGLRHGEIASIKKKDVKGDVLRIYRGKTKVWSEIPITAEMREIIKEAAKLQEGDYVFTAKGKIHEKSYSVLRRACEAVGLEYGRHTAGGLLIHSTRHTFVTRLLRGGVDVATIQSLTSHSDKSMVMRYSHASSESKRKAVESLSGERKEVDWRQVWKDVRDGKMTRKAFVDLVEKGV